MSPVAVWIGIPKTGTHPLFFQSTTISGTKGGTISSDVMSSIENLSVVSKKYNIALENLVLYAIVIGNNLAMEDTENTN